MQYIYSFIKNKFIKDLNIYRNAKLRSLKKYVFYKIAEYFIHTFIKPFLGLEIYVLLFLAFFLVFTCSE